MIVYVIGQGLGSGAGVAYNLTNPLCRDTHSVEAGGYLTIAFPLDNPGAWLMHCHISRHISAGFGVQFLEGVDKIVMPDQTAFDDTCASWRDYAATAIYHQDDSGL